MESFRRARIKSSSVRPELKVKDVNSPLAKYDSDGTLKCVICKTTIKSAVVWKAHINSKQHKLKIEAAKNIQLSKTDRTAVSKNTSVTKAKEPVRNPILKDVSKQIVEPYKQHSAIEVTSQPKEDSTNLKDNSALPEKFFDDPLKDAKVRNIEYKNEQDDEWERFQREIKDESVQSNSIIAGELTEATVDRQIDEIDEQMHRWARVIKLEKKIKSILEKDAIRNAENQSMDSDASVSDEDDTFEEYLDWRSKKF